MSSSSLKFRRDSKGGGCSNSSLSSKRYEETSSDTEIQVAQSKLTKCFCRQTVTKTDGLTIAGAIFFIIGEMAGSGILALPKAFSNAGWIGIPMLIVCCAIAGFEV